MNTCDRRLDCVTLVVNNKYEQVYSHFDINVICHVHVVYL